MAQSEVHLTEKPEVSSSLLGPAQEGQLSVAVDGWMFELFIDAQPQ